MTCGFLTKAAAFFASLWATLRGSLYAMVGKGRLARDN
jgi:hypothetical protein